MAAEIFSHQIESVGTVAGQVWCYLNENGPVDPQQAGPRDRGSTGPGDARGRMARAGGKNRLP